MHSNVTIKNVSWPHFSWATLYMIECFNIWQEQVHYVDRKCCIIILLFCTVYLLAAEKLVALIPGSKMYRRKLL